MVRHIKNYNLQTFLSFQQPPLLRHKLQFKYHHHQKKHHSAVKKKRKEQTKQKKKKKKEKNRNRISIFFFWSTTCNTSTNDYYEMINYSVWDLSSFSTSYDYYSKDIMRRPQNGRFFFSNFCGFLRKADLYQSSDGSTFQYVFIFSWKKQQPDNCRICKTKTNTVFSYYYQINFFLSHSLPHFLHKIWSKVAHLNKKKTSET